MISTISRVLALTANQYTNTTLINNSLQGSANNGVAMNGLNGWNFQNLNFENNLEPENLAQTFHASAINMPDVMNQEIEPSIIAQASQADLYEIITAVNTITYSREPFKQTQKNQETVDRETLIMLRDVVNNGDDPAPAAAAAKMGLIDPKVVSEALKLLTALVDTGHEYSLAEAVASTLINTPNVKYDLRLYAVELFKRLFDNNIGFEAAAKAATKGIELLKDLNPEAATSEGIENLWREKTNSNKDIIKISYHLFELLASFDKELQAAHIARYAGLTSSDPDIRSYSEHLSLQIGRG